MKNPYTELLEKYLALQKEMNNLLTDHNKLLRQHIALQDEAIKDKNELYKYRGIVFSSPSLN